MEKLLRLGYLKREIPFGENPKKSKRSLYKVADPFLDFYFTHIVPNRSFIEVEQSDAAWKRIEKAFPGYVERHWERLCHRAVSKMTIEGKTFGPALRWWGGGSQPEFDVVAESHDRECVLVGECKWTENQKDAGIIMREKINKATGMNFIAGKRIIPILFIKKCPNKKHADILCYSPDDVFIPLRDFTK